MNVVDTTNKTQEEAALEALEVKPKRGRRKLTDEEKAAKKAANEALGANLLNEVKELNKKIKKGVHKLKAKEVEKLKELLTENYEAIDATITVKKAEEAAKQKIQKMTELEELRQKQMRLEAEIAELENA